MRPLVAYGATTRRVLVRQRLRYGRARLRKGEERVVFVVGSPRSGTTFLAAAIGSLPGFADLTEVTPLKAAIPELVQLPEADAAARIRTILQRVRALTFLRGIRSVEQTPETAFVLEAALAAYPDARAVHIVRDGRDVVCSLLERGWLSAERTGADDALLPYGAGARFWVDASRRAEFEAASDAARAAWAWREYVTAARVGDARVLTVPYEALPEAAPMLAEHLDSELSEVNEALAGFDTLSIGRFRRDLTPDQLDEVWTVAGPLLTELGYVN